MKRIRFLIFILLLGITFSVKAENINYYLSNSTQNYEYVDKNNNKAINVKRGDTVTVISIINNKSNANDLKIDNGKITIRWDNKYFSIIDFNEKYYDETISDVQGLRINSANKANNRITLSGITSTGYLKNGINKLVEFKFKVLTDATASTTKIYQMDGEDSIELINSSQTKTSSDSLYSEIKYNINKSTVNSLSMIKIDNHELEYFDEDNLVYDITVESNVEKINISATKKDNKSVIIGDVGEKKLTYGMNKLSIDVISESGVKKTYKLNIEREDSRSSINTLKSLTLSVGDIKFKSDITEYNINVANDVSKVTIKSSLTDSKSRYVEDYQNREIELIEGSNKIEIKVFSEKGDLRVYTVNINRALSGNNSLKSLKVNDDKITLVENEFMYNISYENDIDKVTINAVAKDERALVKVEDEYILQVGNNEIVIKVVAPNGKEASYTLNITRKKLLSKDSLLTNIKIKGYDLKFNQNVRVYNLKIKDEDSLEITTFKEEENATVEIEGNKDLINGSIIKINVKAEDGTFTRYFINIEKGNSGVSPVIIILIVLLILLAGCIGTIVYRKKKKDEKKFDKIDSSETNETPKVIEFNNPMELEETSEEENTDYVARHELEDDNENETEKDIS